jgi:hypothetical protein
MMSWVLLGVEFELTLASQVLYHVNQIPNPQHRYPQIFKFELFP